MNFPDCQPTASAYSHRCILLVKSLIDGSVKGQYAAEISILVNILKFIFLIICVEKAFSHEIENSIFFDGFVLFCLVSLFNGISTLFRLFNANAILLEEQ